MQIKLLSIKIKVRIQANLAHIIASSFQIKWPQSYSIRRFFHPRLLLTSQPCAHLRKNKRFETMPVHFTQKICVFRTIEGGEKRSEKKCRLHTQERKKETDGGAFVQRKRIAALVMCMTHETNQHKMLKVNARACLLSNNQGNLNIKQRMNQGVTTNYKSIQVFTSIEMYILLHFCSLA